jgi:hypothetical protein
MGKLDKDKGKGLGNYTAREDKNEDTMGEDIFTRGGEKGEDKGNIKFDEDLDKDNDEDKRRYKVAEREYHSVV